MKSALYSSPLRPLYEVNSIRYWLAFIALCLVAPAISNTPVLVSVIFAAIAGTSAWGQWRTIAPMYRLQKNLTNVPFSTMTTRALRDIMDQNPGMVWLGRGFAWRQEHAQLNHELMTEQFPHLAHVTGTIHTAKATAKGVQFVHGIGMPHEHDILVPLEHQAGHLLVVGTTGAGKTRLLDILATQAIFRGEAVVVIDPKGDRDLCESLRRSCIDYGDPDRFVYFHPAFPKQSALIDPLGNYNRDSEIASRLAALIQSEGDVFKSFAWMALNKLVSGLLLIEQQPDLVTLKRLLDLSPDRLLEKVLERHFERHLGADWRLKANAKALADHAVTGLIKLYNDLDESQRDSDIDGLVNMVTHNRDHFSKMIASLIPVLTMLTTGALKELLSPGRVPEDDPRLRTNIRAILEEKKVLYVALDSLSDPIVGSAIGSMLLSDTAAVAGDLYNRTGGSKPAPVNIFIDEAAEVINDPTIQLLNKGRGAGMRLTVLTQTFADLEARLGSQAKARQVLGNLNSQIILRTLDGASQKYLAENMPETVIYSIERSQSNTSGTTSPTAFSGSFSERTSETKTPLITSQVLGLLPDLQFFAKVSGSMFFKVRIPILTGASEAQA